MDFRPASFKLLSPVFAAAAMVLSAGAQQAAKPIIFSSAQGGDNTPSTPSLAPQAPAPEQSDYLNTFQAPNANFNFNPPSDSGSLPQMPPTPPVHDQRLQKMLEERKNWALMTPEEIFNVTTPEKIMGVKERDAAGQEIELTQVERFLARQNQPSAAATNGWQNGATAGYWDSSGNQEGDRFNPDGTRRENPQMLLNGLLNSAPENNVTPDRQNEGADWFKSFAPPVSPKPDMEQQAAMERFRQLLESSPATPAATAQSGSGSKFFPAPTTENSIFDQPTVNPIGASITPLSGVIGKPQGLTPLPEITSQNNPQPATVPSWAPQPPPWLSQEPQPFVIPQRKF